jgi:2-methylcitrate dehydratase PrpD
LDTQEAIVDKKGDNQSTGSIRGSSTGIGNLCMGETQTKDVGYTLAGNIARIRYEDIPGDVVDITKKTILDIFGTILGGSGAGAGIKEIVEVVKDGGGKEESSIIGYGMKTNAWMAAFANGAMAHALDYDNVHDDAFTHPSTSTVPAAFAVAERVGKVNGKNFITAVALGDDLHCRLGYALCRAGDFSTQGAWMPPLVLGGFAAAAVSAKLFGLDEERIVDAFGIAFNRTGGSLEIIHDPGLLRGLYAAFPGITGVLAAVMAKYGIPGIKTCFEGKAGLFNVYFRGIYDRDSLTKGLGEVFEGAGVSFKPWPSCRFTNPYVDATLQIVKEHNILPEQVKEIVASYEADNVKNCCEPITARQNPQTPPEAKLSLPFTIAMAVGLRKMEIGDFSPENIKSEVLLSLARKVTPRFDPGLKSSSKTMLPAVVEIKTIDGKAFSKRVDLVYGHPQNPMSWDDLVKKFRDCASYSARPISEKNIDGVVEMITRLEDVQDMREIVGLVS